MRQKKINRFYHKPLMPEQTMERQRKSADVDPSFCHGAKGSKNIHLPSSGRHNLNAMNKHRYHLTWYFGSTIQHCEPSCETRTWESQKCPCGLASVKSVTLGPRGVFGNAEDPAAAGVEGENFSSSLQSSPGWSKNDIYTMRQTNRNKSNLISYLPEPHTREVQRQKR